MKGFFLIIMLVSSRFIFSQQNNYDSLAHKFYDLSEDSTLTYQLIKNDLDKLIISSKKNYYAHKMQEINLITYFLEDLIDLNGKGMMGYCPDIYSGIRYYSDSLYEQQIVESQKNRIFYDFEKIDYCMWNKYTEHPINPYLYEKITKRGDCGPSIFLTFSINNQVFSLLDYEVKNKVTNEITACNGFIFSRCSLARSILDNEFNLDDFIIINFTISDDIGNIFKIEKEFPLFKDYEF